MVFKALSFRALLASAGHGVSTYHILALVEDSYHKASATQFIARSKPFPLSSCRMISCS